MKQIMRKDNVQKLKDGISEAIVKRAQENDDVCFWWRTLCSLTVTLQKHSSLKLLGICICSQMDGGIQIQKKKCPEV